MQLFPSRISYLLIFIVTAINLIWLGNATITLPLEQFFRPALVLATLAALVVTLDRMTYSSGRIALICSKFSYLFQGMIFLQISWISVRLFNHISMTSAFPYTDETLLKWDSLIGLSWERYFHAVQSNSLINTIMGYSYISLTFFSFLGFLILSLQGDLRRTRFFLETFLFTAVICTAIGMLFPAKAAVAMYYGDAKTLANLDALPGVYHIEAMERLRSGAAFALDLNDLPGLVTFPSFHTAAGVILIISFWRTALFPIILAYSGIMIASTPVLGGHYFVDLIAGAAVAALVAWAFGSLPVYRGMFAQPGTEPGAVRPATSG